MELDTAAFEALADLLNRNAERANGIMDFEMLDGYLCGVIVAPKPLPPSQWLPEILGEEAFEDQAQAETVIATLIELHNTIAGRLGAPFDNENEDGDPPLRIYVHRLNPDGSLIETLADADYNADVELPQPDAETAEDDREAVARVGELWSIGFMLASRLAEDAWEQASTESDLYAEALQLSDLLLPDELFDADDADLHDPDFDDGTRDIDADADLDEDDADSRGELEPLTPEERVIALGEMSEVLHELYQLNQRRMAPPQTFRRNAPKVGRNDPCPCGSGRKYKRCHGGN